MYSSSLSWPTALEGGGGSASRPGRSLPPVKTRYPLYRRLGGPQGRSGQVRKISPLLGFDPRTVQPVASRYTGYITIEGWHKVRRSVPDKVHQPHVQQPSTYEKPENCQCSFRLLMMGGVSPETCWASYKYGIIIIWYIVASCWISLYELSLSVVNYIYIYIYI